MLSNKRQKVYRSKQEEMWKGTIIRIYYMINEKKRKIVMFIRDTCNAQLPFLGDWIKIKVILTSAPIMMD